MKDNKLLAEYLGLETFEMFDNRLWAESDKEWHPHEDWNDLMMVVEKIEEEPFIYVEVFAKKCIIVYYDEYTKRHIKSNKTEHTKIESVYNACVEYIKNK